MVSLVLFAQLATAQTVNGNIEGRVLDTRGVPIVGANVSASGRNLIGARSTATDERGFFRILAVPSGVYTLQVRHVSYQPAAVTAVRVPLGSTVTIEDLRLQMRDLEAEEVVVSAERPVIDVTSTSLGQNLTNAQLEGLPLERNYQAISKLLPQANESYYGDGVNIAGATGLETQYFISGIDVSDPNRSSTATILPYNFVREIQVRTGAYEAEYLGSLGGLVNVETYSGGDNVTGQVYGFFTNNNFSGAARQGSSPLPVNYTQYDFGASLGGPILREKLWFFCAYNPTFRREDVPVPGLGTLPDSRTTHIFATKLTWRMNEQNNLQFTIFGDPTIGRMVYPLTGRGATYQVLNPELLRYRMQSGTVNAIASGTHVLADNFLLESFVSFASVKDNLEPESMPAGASIFYQDDVDRTLSGAAITGYDESTAQVAAGVKATMISGSHTLKAGVEYHILHHDVDYWINILDRIAVGSYMEQPQTRQGRVSQDILGAFLQDSWLISPQFRLNFGVRWDPQYLRSSDGHIGQKLLGQVAPRLGLVYLPHWLIQDKVTISAGRFYQLLSMYIQQFYQMTNTSFSITQWDHDPRVDPSGGQLVAQIPGKIQPEIPGMKGQYYDEVTLGYEGQLQSSLRFGVRGVFRTLGEGIEDGLIPPAYSDAVFANPGSPPLQDFPKMTRKYSALEFSLEKRGSGPFSFLASYVLSRTYGNYPGLFDALWNDNRANTTAQFDIPIWTDNALGLLPQDRTHVFKFFGSFAADIGLDLGAFFVWESGVPLSEYGGSWIGFPRTFLSTRGTNGRSPALWDLSFRATYALDRILYMPFKSRLILDFFHIGSPRTAVDYDQTHYTAIDANGNQVNLNPNYLKPVQFQPPMSARLGVEVNF